MIYIRTELCCICSTEIWIQGKSTTVTSPMLSSPSHFSVKLQYYRKLHPLRTLWEWKLSREEKVTTLECHELHAIKVMRTRTQIRSKWVVGTTFVYDLYVIQEQREERKEYVFVNWCSWKGVTISSLPCQLEQQQEGAGSTSDRLCRSGDCDAVQSGSSLPGECDKNL